MYDELLKKFDLTVGEYFSYSGQEYLVLSDGIMKKSSDGTWRTAYKLMIKMLTNKISNVKQWKPKLNDIYYIPNMIGDYYIERAWAGCAFDYQAFNNGLACRTSEEAVSLRREMLNAIL